MLHLVIYSGGMDSFTLLHHVKHGMSEGDALAAISFDYGQRHDIELQFAAAECRRLGIPHEIMRMASSIRRGTSALTSSQPVPHGHYADETMKKTVVPGRNTIMLSVAMGWAESLLNDEASQIGPGGSFQAAVYYGAHSGDHAIYPDCRPAFLNAMIGVFAEATEGRVALLAPFIDMNKESILRRGQEIGLTAEDYGRSWTCYEGGRSDGKLRDKHPQACGKCGSCTERKEAFDALGWQDPALAWQNNS